MKETIAVIGHTGMVGKQVFDYFTDQKHLVLGYSRREPLNSWEEINKKADYIFICVPTPFDWEKRKANLSVVDSCLGQIKRPIPTIIKSTVLPGTTEKFQKKYPHIPLLFNPEFLSATTAEQDFKNPDRQLIGYTKKSYRYATKILHLLPISPYDAIMTATEAEICKYVNNFHGALMVIFSNFFYDICQKTGADYDIVKKAAVASKWVGSPMGRMYWEIFHKGKRGYAGKCFPKDINSLLEWCHDNEINCQILEATKERNKMLLKESGIPSEEAAESYKKGG